MFSSVLRRAVPTALLTLATLTVVGPAAASTSRPVESARRVVDSHVRHGLNSEGRSCGGGCVEVTASGFDPAERVRIRELDRPGWQRIVMADSRGRVCFRVSSHRPVSADVLTFVGLGTNKTEAGSGNVMLSVPRIAVYRFDRH